MGILTTYLIARAAARRQIRQHHAAPTSLPQFPCRECGQPLVLSIHWPGIDPIYWEDHLGGICTNCFDD